jgi:Mg-chelatase subunit ChlD
MSEETEVPGACERVLDAMADVLDGTAPVELLDHVGACERCRDARHEAERAAELAGAAGADYRVPGPEEFETRLGQLLDGRVTSGVRAVSRGASGARPAAGATESATGQAGAAVAPGAVVPMAPREPVLASVRSKRALAWLRRPRNVFAAGLAGAALAAASVALLVRPGAGTGSGPSWHGRVAGVVRATPGAAGGLEICTAGEGEAAPRCRPAEAGGLLPPGALVKTDARTRARLELDDGTSIALDRESTLALDAAGARWARLDAGALVAEVASLGGAPPARVALPGGRLEVLGTKLAVRLVGAAASVDVMRGAVRLADTEGRAVDVRAGEEGRLEPGLAPYAMAAPTLAAAFGFGEGPEADGAVEARGLGELRARKPGSDDERQGAVRLVSHRVKVRIAGSVARTEIEEVFRNETDEVLEGIYRFPLPTDGQIERLALEVEGGKLEEAAFVDRDRAAAIWRGAIVNAGARAKPQEEIVWVPGPWKDPALLEWQRGGRFELRIFPIPRKGARRVILAYTQLVAPTGDVRRYVYPLPLDPGRSTEVDDFAFDVQLRGHDAAFGVRSAGYALESRPGAGADTLALAARRFVPSGDLVVEYALAARESELTAWAYEPEPAATAVAPPAPAPSASARATESEAARAAAVAANVDDGRPYVALALRPKLPRRAESAHRDYAVVVDASRSMFGERFKRATALAARLVAELDPLDRVTVLACDTVCRPGPEGVAAGPAAGREVRDFLGGVTPEGGSDLGASIAQAVASAPIAAERALRVVYVGDGTPTVGAVRPAIVGAEIERALPLGRGTVTAVAVGADADLEALGAVARAGGGVALPYVPGQSVAEAVYAVIGASYGTGLRDARVELPDGLVEIAPSRLDTIVAGGEALVVGRMLRPEVRGQVVLRGKVGDAPFEQRYPVELRATTDRGNAFVPRLYAALRIADLERDGGAEARAQAVALSGRFNVASRFTSLLVLESEAMFRAFGLDNTRRVPEWTGEEEATATEASGADALADDRASVGGPFASSAAPAPAATAGLGLSGIGAGGGSKPSASPDRFGEGRGRLGPPGRSPGGGSCACGPDDLLCSMRCASKADQPLPQPLPVPPAVMPATPAPGPAPAASARRACAPGDPLCSDLGPAKEEEAEKRKDAPDKKTGRIAQEPGADQRPAPRDEAESQAGPATLVAIAIGGSCAFAVDGVSHGTRSSIRVEVSPGPHTVSCTTSGGTRTQRVNAQPGKPAIASFKLGDDSAPTPGSQERGVLAVVARGGSCSVVVDGVVAGSTPVTVSVRPGAHAVTCAPPVGAARRASVTVVAGQTSTVAFRLDSAGPELAEPRRRGLVPMRRTFEREAFFSPTQLVPAAASADVIAKLEGELAQNEGRRAVVQKLFSAYERAGRLDQAGVLAERWAEKEPLDAEALVARADVAARRGERELAVRILGSVVDVRPGDVGAQRRLERLHRWAGRAGLACRHALAVAQLRARDAARLADAVRCLRATEPSGQAGAGAVGGRLLADADAATRRVAEELLAKEPPPERVGGELRFTATWDDPRIDLDVALVNPAGHRLSWLGSTTREILSAEDVESTRREVLGVLGTESGEYVIEIARARGEGRVRGELRIEGPELVRTVPFELDGDRRVVGVLRIGFRERLVPLTK